MGIPRRIIWGITLTSTALIGLCSMGLIVSQVSRESARIALRDSRETIIATERLLLSVLKAETAQRGFVLTNDNQYLLTCYQSIARSEIEFSTIQALVKDPKSLSRLQGLVKAKGKDLEQVIDIRKESGQIPAIEYIKDGRGKGLTEAIAQEIDQLVFSEKIKIGSNGLFYDYQSSVSTGLTFVVITASMTLFAILSQTVWEELRSRNNRINEAHSLSLLKEQWIAGIAHDLRGIITVIHGSVELLDNYGEQLVEANKSTYYDRIYKACSQLTHMLDSLLLITKAEARKLELDIKPTNLKDLAKETIDNNSSLQHPGTVQVVGRERPAPIDRRLFSRLLSNLVTNAIKYSPNGGRVIIRISYELDLIRLQCIDEGQGIPPHNLANLFAAFQRGENVGNVRGSGLGLAVVKLVAEAHKGRVEIQSDLGRGSTFTVLIPG